MLTVDIEKKKTLSSITPLNTESNGNGFVIIFLYVDGLIYLGNVQMIKDFKRKIMSRFYHQQRHDIFHLQVQQLNHFGLSGGFASGAGFNNHVL